MRSLRNITQFIKVSYIEFKLSLSSEFAYRWQVFVWVISDAIQPAIWALLWSTVAQGGDRAFTPSDMVSYYFMVAIVSKFTYDWSIQFVSNSIIAGDFSKYLIRPFNYLSEMFGISLAIRLLRLILLIPLMITAYFVIGPLLSYEINTQSTLLFLLAVLLGFLLNFILGNIFALLAFYVKQILGLRALYTNVLSILSGEYIPLQVFAAGSIFLVFEALPFRYVLSFPIEIISGNLVSSQISRGFIIGVVWLLALILVYQLSFRFAIKKYESEGI